MFCPVCRADYPADYKVCPRDATHLLASSRIGKYQIEALVGVGGMGAVYRAVNPDTKARVAIKLMNPSVAGAEPARARFQREAAAVAALRTTHVVKVFDFGTEADGTLYLVMELLDGHTLRDEILRAPSLMDLARVQLVMDGALKGLAAAHRAGIVHRDLKPDNVFVADTDDGEVPKLLDFGIARVTATDSDLTHTGSLMGTAAYMAVEQVSTGSIEVGPWSDVYAMGTILYEMLTGAPAYGDGTLTEVLHRVLKADVPPLRTLRPGLPTAIYDLVERCTSLDASKRPQDAEAMRVALAAAQLVSPGTAIPPPTLSSARRVELGTAPTEGRDTPSPIRTDGALAATAITTPVDGATSSMRAPAARDAYRDTIDATTRVRPSRGAAAAHDATIDASAVAGSEPGSTAPGARPVAADPPTAAGRSSAPRSSGSPIAVAPIAPSRTRWPLILGALAIAGIGGVFALRMLRTPPDPGPSAAPAPSAAQPVEPAVITVTTPRSVTGAAPPTTDHGAPAPSTADAAAATETATAAPADAAAPTATATPADATAVIATATPADAAAVTTTTPADSAAATAAPADAAATTVATEPCDAKALRDAARAANQAKTFKRAIELAQTGLTCGGNEPGLHAAIVFAACKLHNDKLVMKHYYSVSRPRIEDARTICSRQRGAAP